jgi:hypothetical protein
MPESSGLFVDTGLRRCGVMLLNPTACGRVVYSLNHSTLLSSLRMLQLEPNAILRVTFPKRTSSFIHYQKTLQ